MKVGQAIKLLKKAGFIETNQVGSHKKFQKVGKSITIIYHSKNSEDMCKKAIKQLNKILQDDQIPIN